MFNANAPHPKGKPYGQYAKPEFFYQFFRTEPLHSRWIELLPALSLSIHSRKTWKSWTLRLHWLVFVAQIGMGRP